MRLEKKILKGLGEYFLGLETKKELDYQRAFYIESIPCKDCLGKFLYYLDEVERRCINLGKYFLILIEQTGLIASLVTKRYEWAVGGLITGNLLRINLLPFNPAKDGREILKENIKALDNGKSLEEFALDLSEHWGNGVKENNEVEEDE